MEVPGSPVASFCGVPQSPSPSHLAAWPISRARVSKRSCEGMAVNILGFVPHTVCHDDLTLPLQHQRSATDDTEMNRCGRAPRKLDLQKQSVGRMWFTCCSLPAPVLRHRSHQLEPPGQPADRGRVRRISRERSEQPGLEVTTSRTVTFH